MVFMCSCNIKLMKPQYKSSIIAYMKYNKILLSTIVSHMHGLNLFYLLSYLLLAIK